MHSTTWILPEFESRIHAISTTWILPEFESRIQAIIAIVVNILNLKPGKY